MPPAVTVVTVTRGRAPVLRRAIESVRAQAYDGPITHLVIVDDCAETSSALRGIDHGNAHRALAWREVLRDSTPDAPGSMAEIYGRLAALLNLGVRLASTPWIAFLDDDNEYEPTHIASLIDCALRCSSVAVHSWRRIFHHDGRPYLEPLFPWARNDADGRRLYEMMRARGVWERASNVLRDRAGPFGLTRFRNSTIMTDRDPVCMVDTSVWLLDRALLTACPWPERFTAQDVSDNNAPDDKLLEALLAREVRIVCTGQPTLRYYLGGISN